MKTEFKNIKYQQNKFSREKHKKTSALLYMWESRAQALDMKEYK